MKYIFRGINVFEYNPERKEILIPTDNEHRNNFNFCKFIPDDFILISDFFKNAHLHSIGQITTEELKDIEVN